MQIVQQQRQASARCCEVVGALAAVGAFAAVGVFADAGQQNLVEWLKGVRRYELSGCLRRIELAGRLTGQLCDCT